MALDSDSSIFVEDLGIRRSLLEDLALKILHFLGEASVQELAERMQIGQGLTDALVQHLRTEQLCRATGIVDGVYRVIPTSAGNERALERLTVDRYTGPVPVSLSDYVKRVEQQAVQSVDISKDELASALADLVLPPSTIRRLGTAVGSGRGIFLYGPTGNGKTSLALKLGKVLRKDVVSIPYAVEADGQIITVFDPAVHERIPNGEPLQHDRRWVPCHRPCVVAGGELTLDMLDLRFDPITRYYAAPLQMSANNGVLVIDDFGRQRMRPEELLNRWVVPLDRRVDFFDLAGGSKIQVPFDVLPVFATNLDPKTMVEEAFLRRIQTKIKLDYATPEQFRDIFRLECGKIGVPYDAAVADHLIRTIAKLGHQLCACYPSDILRQIGWAAKWDHSKLHLDIESIEEACQNYFVF